MFVGYVVVTILAAAANAFAAANDFIRPKWLLANMVRVGVPESWLTTLGVLKTAGTLGLLAGIAVPVIGMAAAAGLVLFFIGAIITHLRARDYSPNSLGVPVVFFLLAVVALVMVALHAT